ncbi:flagellar motor switch phosphatase FliY [Peribacillus psychrosaccharolyticus]|uniref:Flagellar motor switch phosphatase FliY n=1 Tax=Peribacillus psychrosaccharolyticus TaxID=1407 RepID=A0A974NP29_PERPY|nr:flagellar motor switch phosphatase FliY [Peribacillus psychrosaccharolyticus]MEC2053814.1 flagellar motor switch phosphatase FliY [Peribacillus psychrosaccharolyticus]MED3742572.1 flagellar motor switch phosphatase FliY [Peribacillus psychrosaccharolyticus]QQT01521.1 flagellar motor switch phosphatase FliY [Peribacillus psychrosaccharolyticus]
MMSEDMLSQDEIDALLRGTDDLENSETQLIDSYLSLMEQDTLGEIGNISFGSSATALSTLLNQKVEITTPNVTLVERTKIADEFPQPYVAIQVSYTMGFSGINLLVIKQSDAAIIADLMLGGTGTNTTDGLGEIQLSAVQEAMNQMMGSAATSMSTIFNKKVDISPPSVDLLDFEHGKGEGSIPNDHLFVKISFRLKVGELIDSNIMQLLPYDFAQSLVNELLNPNPPVESNDSTSSQYHTEPAGSKEPAIDTQREREQKQNQLMNESAYSMQNSVQTQTRDQQRPEQPQHFGSSHNAASEPINVQPASFSSFQPYQMERNEASNLNMLLDIPLNVTVELGRTQRSVKEILELSSGSIIELDKLAGEPVDILVNNRLIATGEVVVIDENFGVRVTDIVSQTDRLKNLDK